MNNTFSKSRQQAEIAFGKTQGRTAPQDQARASSRDRAFDELDSIKAAREAKTLRLRTARLAMEIGAREIGAKEIGAREIGDGLQHRD
ncbi:hypothetical protein BTR14_07180 [Rhizobium rhizosphaerae]|uniref:Uncharacterized protein n=1 Tax=Xaviernesmea rhizosphaerae TaxID=1672749 RepID=A0ABX3PGA3_9HYPH|nr:hypothetical protein [Xaviernesmea rhizosphaerae]OQP87195.1 hypothetical protein BTR14_07180 [Xaviernesmea rhizosphaerae]